MVLQEELSVTSYPISLDEYNAELDRFGLSLTPQVNVQEGLDIDVQNKIFNSLKVNYLKGKDNPFFVGFGKVACIILDHINLQNMLWLKLKFVNSFLNEDEAYSDKGITHLTALQISYAWWIRKQTSGMRHLPQSNLCGLYQLDSNLEIAAYAGRTEEGYLLGGCIPSHCASPEQLMIVNSNLIGGCRAVEVGETALHWLITQKQRPTNFMGRVETDLLTAMAQHWAVRDIR